MTKEQDREQCYNFHMLPRYKVISDWPGRRDFTVGEIVVLDKMMGGVYPMYVVEDCQGPRNYIDKFFEMFPLQFKKLKWFEEIDELPDYCKNEQGEVFLIHKKHPTKDKVIIENQLTSQYYEFLDDLYPATRDEYITQFEKKM